MNAQPAGWFPDPHDAAQLRYWNGAAWTEHRSPRDLTVTPPLTPRPPVPPPGPTGKWYFVITIASIGLLAAVPYFHAASRLERPQLRKTGASLAVAGILGWALVAVAPEDETGSPTGWLPSVAVVILLGVVLMASLQLIGLRREVYQSPIVPRPPSGNQAAMANVEKLRRTREAARQLALRDPMMARELGIGRPGSPQGYDDGGLLDLNVATSEQLTALCGLPAEVAQQVVESRSALGRFLQLEDAIMFGPVGEEYAAQVRERGIVIADR